MSPFRKTKSTPDLHRPREYRPHEVLEECLELESLIEDMEREYICMLRPDQHFRRPTPISLHKILAELRESK